MPFPLKTVVGLGVLTTVQVTPSMAWNYESTAADQWATGTCAADVSAQSPINIVETSVAEASAQTPPQAYNFDWEGAPDSGGEDAIHGGLVINNHTLEVEWDVTDAATDKYGIKVGDKLYRLRQFHYHSPSEHTVDGNHYDMEAHHVHFCEGISCETPDNPDDEILVVAVFLRQGSTNNYLNSFWNQYTQGTEPSVSGLANPYLQFIPSDRSYYSYVGSTTTPPCAQNVQWRILTTAVEMSQEQLTTYHQKVNALTQPATPAAPPPGVSTGWVASWKTNNRPVQELGDRTVLHFVPPPAVDEESSFPLMPLLAALAALALLAAGVCVWLNQKPAKKPATRAVKPKPPPPAPKEAPKEETVPLMPPPLLAAPNLSMVVQPQPLIQAVPQTYTTAARPVAMAPYGQAPMVLQP